MALMLCEIDDVPHDVRVQRDLAFLRLFGRRQAILQELRIMRAVCGRKAALAISRDIRDEQTPYEREMNALRRQRRRRHFELNPHLRSKPCR